MPHTHYLSSKKNDYPLYLTFPSVSLWRMPPMGSLQLGHVSCCVGLPHFAKNYDMSWFNYIATYFRNNKWMTIFTLY